MKNINRERFGVYLDQLTAGEVKILWAEGDVTGAGDVDGVRKWSAELNQYLQNIENFEQAVQGSDSFGVELVELEQVLTVATQYAMASVGRVAQKVGVSV